MSQKRREALATGRGVGRRVRTLADRYSLPMLRYALVVVFVWFGALTAAGVGNFAGVVAAALGTDPSAGFQVALGGWEVAAGAALLHRRTVRLGVVLVAIHTGVTALPLLVIPHETFAYVPYGPSFEGVYIVKNWVLLGGAMTVGGAVD